MHVFITGVSTGLGKAFAEHFIHVNTLVTGIGRKTDLSAPNFQFITCDLSSIDEVKNCSLKSKDQEILLINNAGIIGEIKRVSEQDQSDLSEVMQVNTIAPMLLCQKVLRENPGAKVTILNISSGAANRPIPSWAAYCASKIALDRFSETLQEEENEKQASTRVFALAPGIINTQMQEKIRVSSPLDFSSVESFKKRHENQELLEPKYVVIKAIELINNQNTSKVIWSINEL
jgi:benzil reductase ((S)-benzoin forming)